MVIHLHKFTPWSAPIPGRLPETYQEVTIQVRVCIKCNLANARVVAYGRFEALETTARQQEIDSLEEDLAKKGVYG